MMRRLQLCFFTLLLISCSQFTTTPKAPPPAGPEAQEINRAQTPNLRRLGTISVTVRGSPDDAERAIAAKANTVGATWYMIQLVSETVMPGYWYSTAILYGPPVPATDAK